MWWLKCNIFYITCSPYLFVSLTSIHGVYMYYGCCQLCPIFVCRSMCYIPSTLWNWYEISIQIALTLNSWFQFCFYQTCIQWQDVCRASQGKVSAFFHWYCKYLISKLLLDWSWSQRLIPSPRRWITNLRIKQGFVQRSGLSQSFAWRIRAGECLKIRDITEPQIESSLGTCSCLLIYWVDFVCDRKFAKTFWLGNDARSKIWAFYSCERSIQSQVFHV